jgi:hypothetical protein
MVVSRPYLTALIKYWSRIIFCPFLMIIGLCKKVVLSIISAYPFSLWQFLLVAFNTFYFIQCKGLFIPNVYVLNLLFFLLLFQVLFLLAIFPIILLLLVQQFSILSPSWRMFSFDCCTSVISSLPCTEIRPLPCLESKCLNPFRNLNPLSFWVELNPQSTQPLHSLVAEKWSCHLQASVRTSLHIYNPWRGDIPVF